MSYLMSYLGHNQRNFTRTFLRFILVDLMEIGLASLILMPASRILPHLESAGYRRVLPITFAPTTILLLGENLVETKENNFQ